jgi:hypothetical protein
MKASVWSSGQGKFGINVGHPRRREFFDTGWADVELELDGEFHNFPLLPGFLRHCPEIRDTNAKILQEWLRRHGLLDWPKGDPPKVELIQLGGNRFRVLPP